MKNIEKWFLLLNKRLYKKATFLLILVLIPLLAMGYGAVARDESGMLTVALACEGEDPTAVQIMQELKDGSNLIRFVICDDPETARSMVNGQRADAAWIFEDELEEAVYRFAADPARKNAFVQIIEGESTIPLKLVREKLSGVIFARSSRAYYLDYLRNNVPEVKDVPDEELLQYYDNFAADATFFEFAYLDGGSKDENAPSANYLLSPVRGLLAVVIVLGGLAAAMYYIQDEKLGTFSLVAQNRKAPVEFGCQMIAVLNVSVVALIALIFSGLTVSLGRELLLLLLYALSTALFCMTLRRIFGSIAALGTLLPLLVVGMLVVCPVFFDLGALRQVQYLFPPTYYINAVNSDYFLGLQVIYIAALLGVNLLKIPYSFLRRKFYAY